jgi:hypothetical protein
MRLKPLWRLAIYVFIVVSIASCRAWQIHRAPIDCADTEGHGPDPGTSECLGSIAREREGRPQATKDAFLAVILLGGLGLGGFGAFRLAVGIRRRFALGEDASA